MKMTRSRPAFASLAITIFVLAAGQAFAQTVTVIPQEYTSGMRNPLMGFRSGQQSGPHGDAGIPTESELVADAADNLADLSMYPYCVLVRDYIHFNVLNDNASDLVQRIKDYSNNAYRNYETKNIKVIPRVILMYTAGNNPPHEYWPSDLTDGDWTSQAVRDRVVAVVRQMGEAWDNDSRIAWVQMGLIGQRGEQESPVGIGQDLGGGVTWAQILEPVFKEAFPNKKVLVRSPEKWGADFQVGMYWDTFGANGKMNGPNDEWPRIKANNLAPRESYKKAPIEGEVAYNFVLSNQMGTSQDATMQTADYRQFFIDTVRSTETTACGIGYDPGISASAAGASEVQKAFGYRFLLKEFTSNNRVEPGATLNFSAKVVNAGSAPTYANWPLAVVLIDESSKQIVWTSPTLPNVDITQWLPGTGYQWNFVDGQLGTGSRTYANPAPTNVITGAVTIPSNLAPNSYLVGLSILDPTTGQPGIFFSVTNFLQASNTQPLARIGVGMNAGTSAISFDPYNWLNDTRRYNLTTGRPTVTVAATDASAGEPVDNGTFTFTRSGSTSAELTVNIAVGGTAGNGTDYSGIGATVTIPAGQSSITQNVGVIDDNTVEVNETVIVTLQSNAAYTIESSNSATVTITDNDVLPIVSVIGAWTQGTQRAIAPGTNRVLVVTVMGEHNTSDFSATSVTYGGQLMTKQAERVLGTTFRTYSSIFTLNASGLSAATSEEISVGWSSAPAGFDVYSVLLGNVDQTNPVGQIATNSLSGTAITTTALVAAEGDRVVFAGATAGNNTQTANNGFTKQFESNSGWGDGVGGDKIGTGIAEIPGFTQSTSGRMVICAMVVRRENAGPAPNYGSWSLLSTLPFERRGAMDRNGPLDLPNMLCYAMGSDPLIATIADLPTFGAYDAVNGPISIRYRRATNVPDITLAPIVSTTMDGWQPAEILQSTVVEDGGEWELVEISVPAPSEGRLFFKLQAQFIR